MFFFIVLSLFQGIQAQFTFTPTCPIDQATGLPLGTPVDANGNPFTASCNFGCEFKCGCIPCRVTVVDLSFSTSCGVPQGEPFCIDPCVTPTQINGNNFKCGDRDCSISGTQVSCSVPQGNNNFDCSTSQLCTDSDLLVCSANQQQQCNCDATQVVFKQCFTPGQPTFSPNAPVPGPVPFVPLPTDPPAVDPPVDCSTAFICTQASPACTVGQTAQCTCFSVAGTLAAPKQCIGAGSPTPVPTRAPGDFDCSQFSQCATSPIATCLVDQVPACRCDSQTSAVTTKTCTMLPPANSMTCIGTVVTPDTCNLAQPSCPAPSIGQCQCISGNVAKTCSTTQGTVQMIPCANQAACDSWPNVQCGTSPSTCQCNAVAPTIIVSKQCSVAGVEECSDANKNRCEQMTNCGGESVTCECTDDTIVRFGCSASTMQIGIVLLASMIFAFI